MDRSAFLPAILVTASLLVGCGSPDRVVLGGPAPRTYHFGVPALVSGLESELGTGNPTLTADLLEIFFTRGDPADPANSRVWSATRPTPDAAFDTPRILTEIVADGDDTSSAISSDGLTLWFGSDRSGGLGAFDIWVSTRPSRSATWLLPTNLSVLNSAVADVPRPLGDHDQVMPMSSERSSTDGYQILFATAQTPDGPLDSPTPAPGLTAAGLLTVDGFLTDDGLTIFYTRAASGSPGDLFVSGRRSSTDAFDGGAALTDLNTGGEEADPWLSPDGTQLYFASDRSGVMQIYVAAVTP